MVSEQPSKSSCSKKTMINANLKSKQIKHKRVIVNAANYRVKNIWMKCDMDKHDQKSAVKVKRKVRLP